MTEDLFEMPIGKVTKKPRIVYDYFVTLDNQEFDLYNLVDILDNIYSGKRENLALCGDISKDRYIKILKKYKIICEDASCGSKFKEFYNKILKLYEETWD